MPLESICKMRYNKKVSYHTEVVRPMPDQMMHHYADMPSKELILVVDDEQDIRTLLRILFEKEGWTVAEAANGREALSFAKNGSADISLIVMDIMMPVMNGIEAAEKLRSMTGAPILFLTARSSDADKTEAYRSGADDYIVKPFYATDLRLKAHAMISRYRRYRDTLVRLESTDHDDVYSPAAGIEIRFHEKVVTKNGKKVMLTDREYALLCFFCRHRQKTLSPAEIYEAVWEEPYLNTSSNTVIVHIANLRKKLEQDGGTSFIRTVWGKGYRID